MITGVRFAGLGRTVHRIAPKRKITMPVAKAMIQIMHPHLIVLILNDHKDPVVRRVAIEHLARGKVVNKLREGQVCVKLFTVTD